MMRKYFAIGIALIVLTGGIVSFILLVRENPAAPDTHQSHGDVIAFGGLEWIVLATIADRSLLLSNHVFEPNVLNHDFVETTWETSHLRQYLNTEFLSRFSEEEVSRIHHSTSHNHENPWFGTDAGPDTMDYIFVLSAYEAVRFFGDSGQFAARPDWSPWPIDDEYNQNRIAYDFEGYPARWWLRTPGSVKSLGTFVVADGRIGMFGINVNTETGFRPALWLYH